MGKIGDTREVCLPEDTNHAGVTFGFGDDVKHVHVRPSSSSIWAASEDENEEEDEVQGYEVPNYDHVIGRQIASLSKNPRPGCRHRRRSILRENVIYNICAGFFARGLNLHRITRT